MNRILLASLLTVTAHSAFGENPNVDTLVVQTKIYCDHCDACETCKPHIERDLSFAKGIKKSTVNVQEQTVTVYFNPKKTSPADIRQAIAGTGYDADEVKAVPKAAAKLDECCRPK